MTPERLKYLTMEIVLRGECANITRDELYEALSALASAEAWRARAERAEAENNQLVNNAFDANQRAREARAAADRSLAVLAARSASGFNMTEVRDRAYQIEAERELLRMQKLHILTIDAIAQAARPDDAKEDEP